MNAITFIVVETDNPLQKGWKDCDYKTAEKHESKWKN